ncbi:MAG: aspartyl/glutamyl-tRNA amidotransferase subunit C [Bacilli bacterium]|jgi:aspartyl-tRNA(Asn)/glutamyl-tRNA(Gln) amidotransferase subunit C|nr:aspartyl/glutamyl-tRNA amidotransferase subunit C [Bacilli bacterium]
MNEEQIIKLLKKLSFSLPKEQIDLFKNEFEILQKHLEMLNVLVKDKEIEPLVFPLEIEVSSMREDIPTKPLSQEEVLKNASNKEAGQIKIPKVL